MPDSGSGLQGGFGFDGQSSTSNAQCTLSAAGSSATVSGSTLTLALNITFKPAFAGNKIVYLAARDQVLANSGWQALGLWNIGGQGVGPVASVSASPARGAGAGHVFTFTFSDTNTSWNDLNVVNVLINSGLDGAQACYIAYSLHTAPSPLLYLVDDTGTALLPAVHPGSGSAANAQCMLLGAGSSASGSGSLLTLNLNI